MLPQKKSLNTYQRNSLVEWELKTFLLFAILVILGLIFLAISLVPSIAKNVLLASFFSQISTALIISGLYTGISEMFLKQNFLKANNDNYNELITANEEKFQKLFEIFHLAEVSKTIGLVEAVPSDSFYDQSEWIINAQNLKVLLRDGTGWLSRYSIKLKRRFADPNKTTTILLLDPNSNWLEINANKLNTTSEDFQFKIASTVANLQKLASDSTKLCVLGYPLYNTYHLVLADDFVMMNFYPSSSLSFKSPSWVFKDVGDDCYFQHLKQDIEALERESSSIMGYRKRNDHSED